MNWLFNEFFKALEDMLFPFLVAITLTGFLFFLNFLLRRLGWIAEEIAENG